MSSIQPQRSSSPRGLPSRRAFLRLWAALPLPLLLAACRPAGADPTSGLAPPVQPTTPAAPAGAGGPSPTRAVPPTAAQTAPAPTSAATPRADAARQPAAPTAAAQLLPSTPACGDADDPTPPQTAGPFFKPSSPERTSLLEPGMTGTKLLLTGQVLMTDCRPVAGALVDFWQADDAGAYDNAGHRLRGHQFADAQGRYTLETVVPGLYPGRTRHLHVNVQAPNRPVLTTQLYFPDEARNRADRIFNAALLIHIQDTASGQTGAFNFVLKA